MRQKWLKKGGKEAGSTLTLTWPSAQTVGQIVLYDRPNGNDQILGATLSFSDGSSVVVGALNNDGSATALTFVAKTITSLKLTVTSVSATTQNIGLSEIVVLGA